MITINIYLESWPRLKKVELRRQDLSERWIRFFSRPSPSRFCKCYYCPHPCLNDIFRKAAMDWMREQGYNSDDIVLMQSKLKIKWLENHPSVPPGWKTRKSKIKTNVRPQSCFITLWYLRRIKILPSNVVIWSCPINNKWPLFTLKSNSRKSYLGC